MRIAADSKIPFAEEAFADWGEVTSLPTKAITAETVRSADLLLVRSETPVNRSLLDGSRVRFVGTATIGTDHIDQDFLNSAGIGFAAAPGCNADSVKEYMTAALLVLARRRGLELRGRSLGVVGVGNIGGRVARVAAALGMETLLNDPPLRRRSGERRFLELDQLMEADFITLHVPLIRDGVDKTWHLFDERRLSRLKPTAVVFNTSRGPVMDNKALKEALKRGRLGGAVLDVWEGEPNIDVELMSLAELATSHIAGYSLDGKVRGTEMIYQSACRYFGRPASWTGFDRLPPPAHPEVEIPPASNGTAARLHGIVGRCYDIEADDDRLRAISTAPPAERPDFFRALRKNYPIRREFAATRVAGAGEENILAVLREIGFR